MGTREALVALDRLAKTEMNDTKWLRERYADTKSLNDVVRMQSEEWAK